MTEIPDKAISSGYDGRLQYHEVLGSLLKLKTMSAINKDYYTYERCLRQILYMIKPFMKGAEWSRLKESLDRAKNYLGNKQFTYFTEKELDSVDSSVIELATDIFLPVSRDDFAEDIDWEQWEKESDL